MTIQQASESKPLYFHFKEKYKRNKELIDNLRLGVKLCLTIMAFSLGWVFSSYLMEEEIGRWLIVNWDHFLLRDFVNPFERVKELGSWTIASISFYWGLSFAILALFGSKVAEYTYLLTFFFKSGIKLLRLTIAFYLGVFFQIIYEFPNFLNIASSFGPESKTVFYVINVLLFMLLIISLIADKYSKINFSAPSEKWKSIKIVKHLYNCQLNNPGKVSIALIAVALVLFVYLIIQSLNGDWEKLREMKRNCISTNNPSFCDIKLNDTGSSIPPN
ncbi:MULTISPECIES: hypothetical protein [unclassified Pseudoalteromonas]|uniref:hypothetical protein n=1 Tax=unclassified Pseudoalteromonas TaxID=194690 RepID=UPI0016036F75|nr:MULTISPECIES: hypothetical protein [unclassified Pseudoalteromonas]MBB1352316.1 hypothetical protein [Pseudoalteromonas sp. SG45-3]MBB1360240.1 hypothetical protein [Pseudoalteromonas sp. SG45-6]